MYSVDVVPEKMRTVFNLNPMTPVIVAYRDILYYKKIPELGTLVQAVCLGMVLLVVGMVVFSRLKRHFAEEL